MLCLVSWSLRIIHSMRSPVCELTDELVCWQIIRSFLYVPDLSCLVLCTILNFNFSRNGATIPQQQVLLLVGPRGGCCCSLSSLIIYDCWRGRQLSFPQSMSGMNCHVISTLFHIYMQYSEDSSLQPFLRCLSVVPLQRLLSFVAVINLVIFSYPSWIGNPSKIMLLTTVTTSWDP